MKLKIFCWLFLKARETQKKWVLDETPAVAVRYSD